MRKILLLVPLLALLGFGCNAQTATQRNADLNQNPKPLVQTPKDETANWKTYRNTQYYFEFKYPADQYERDDLKGFRAQPDEKLIISLRRGRGLVTSEDAEVWRFQVRVRSNPEKLSSSEYAKKYFHDTAYPNQNIKTEITELSGVKGVSFGEMDRVILIARSNVVFMITPDYNILPTFRFIQ